MFESHVDVPLSQKPVFGSTTSIGDQASKRDKVRESSLFIIIFVLSLPCCHRRYILAHKC